MRDRVIRTFPAGPFGNDLMLTEIGTIAYQKSTADLVEYDADYFRKYQNYEGSAIAQRLNAFRVAWTRRKRCVLDVGIGSGEYIVSRLPMRTLGYDVNLMAEAWLRERRIWCDPYEHLPREVDGLTLWDVLEHMPSPSQLFDMVRPGAEVFLSLPIFEDLTKVRQSKHYRPGEHLLYFTHEGLVTYMTACGFVLIETSDEESCAGRESIESFRFFKADW